MDNKIKKVVYKFLDLYFNDAEYVPSVKRDGYTEWEGYILKNESSGEDILLIGKPIIEIDNNIWYYDGTYIMDPEIVLGIHIADFKKAFVSYMKDKFNKDVDRVL